MADYFYYLSDGCSFADLPSPSAGSLPVSLNHSFRSRSTALVRLLAKQVAREVPPLAVDLIDVARGLFVIDCEARRPQNTHGNNWQRVITVQIPVRSLEWWRRREVGEALSGALDFVSGDRWHIEFVPYTGWREDPVRFLHLDPPQRVCLFSEGLDSLGGLFGQSEREPTERFLAFSAITQWQCRPRIDRVRAQLNRHYANRFDPVVFLLHRHAYKDRLREERSQRLRSFLLLAIGGAVAVAAGCSRLDVYENGLEAFNFPSCAKLAPGIVSRAMHPLFLFRMSQFLTALTDSPFDLTAPYLFHTKADLVRELQSANGTALIGETVSCIHFPQRRPETITCGNCKGCLLRKIALQYTGLSHLVDGTDFHKQPRRREADLECYKMDLLIHRLEGALRSRKPFGNLLSLSGIERNDWGEFIQACARSAQVPTDEVAPRMIALFSRYVQEWSSTQRPSPISQSKMPSSQPPNQVGESVMGLPEQEACTV